MGPAAVPGRAASLALTRPCASIHMLPCPAADLTSRTPPGPFVATFVLSCGVGVGMCAIVAWHACLLAAGGVRTPLGCSAGHACVAARLPSTQHTARSRGRAGKGSGRRPPECPPTCCWLALRRRCSHLVHPAALRGHPGERTGRRHPQPACRAGRAAAGPSLQAAAGAPAGRPFVPTSRCPLRCLGLSGTLLSGHRSSTGAESSIRRAAAVHHKAAH